MPESSRSDSDLRRVLGEIQRRGAIGRVPIDDAVDHADQFALAVPVDARTLLDLGSGGGLPALVIAVRRPDLHLTLVERRHKRADLLRYAVRALQLDGQVEVFAHDIAAVSPDTRVDVVTARSFGPIDDVLRVANGLLRPGGACVVSTPPEGVDIDAPDFDDDGQWGAVHRWIKR